MGACRISPVPFSASFPFERTGTDASAAHSLRSEPICAAGTPNPICSEDIRMKNTAIALSLLIGLSAVTTSTAEDVMIVYDGSNSMWGQIDGIAKIETAREVMADLIETWPQSTNLGLMAYGHRREGDCGDIELMIPPGPVDANSFLATVNGITPRGKTPLTDAVVEAAETLSFRDNPATVVLISDGIESCQADPCSIAAELEQQGIAFTTHVIGFDVAREDQRQLSCIAENTGGTFVPAQDADELRNAMTQVQAVIQTAPEPEPQPEPEPEPEAPEQTVSAPATVTFGTEFTVTWGETINPRDWITIVPVGADEGDYLAFQRVQGDDSVEIRAPADPGLYEVRYVLDEGSKTLASTPVEVVEAEQSVSAPGIVRAESTFEVSWSETVNPRDWVTIVPVGADEGDYLAFQRVQGNDSVELQAPADPGLYEVRYVLDEGSKTLASSPVEVVAADAPLDDGAGLSVPASAAPGETISVSWTIAPEDADRRVTLAASDAPDFTWISAHPVGPETETDITLPAEPGQYEVRFLDLGRQEVLGRAIIAVGD